MTTPRIQAVHFTPPDIFPVALSVAINAVADEPDPTSGTWDGTSIYIGKTTVWLEQAGRWVRWSPKQPMELEVFGDTLYATPCVTHGMQLVSTQKEHADTVNATRLALRGSIAMLEALHGKLAGWLEATKAMELIASSMRDRAEHTPAQDREATSETLPKTRTRWPTQQLIDSKSRPRVTKKEDAMICKAKGSNDNGESVPKAINKGKCKERTKQDTEPQPGGGKQGGLDIVSPSEPGPKHCKTMPIMHSLVAGMTCPPGTQTLEWPHIGVTTNLPWFSNMDYEMVERMAKAPRAQDYECGPNRPMIVELNYHHQDSRVMHILTKQIEEALSQGSAVLVRGWEATPILDFTMEDIRLFRPTISQKVVIQADNTTDA